MSDYFDHVRPTYLENWPAELCRLSIAQVDVPLTVIEAAQLGANIMELGEQFVPAGGTVPDITAIRERVQAAVSKFPSGAFVRLGSRSPKDAWIGHRLGFRITADGKPHGDPLRLLLDCSERIADDLLLAIANGYAPHIFVRQWLDFPPWAECRCFIRGRNLVGISQYNYLHHEVFPEIAEHESLIRWGIGLFFERDFRPASHLDDVVMDVICFVRRIGNESSIEVKLLEINPFGQFTDPCLFDWRNGGNFDGSFRYHKAKESEAAA